MKTPGKFRSCIRTNQNASKPFFENKRAARAETDQLSRSRRLLNPVDILEQKDQRFDLSQTSSSFLVQSIEIFNLKSLDSQTREESGEDGRVACKREGREEGQLRRSSLRERGVGNAYDSVRDQPALSSDIASRRCLKKG